jgi:hypothetical protein
MVCSGNSGQARIEVCELLRESLQNENFADVAAHFAIDDPAAR